MTTQSKAKQDFLSTPLGYIVIVGGTMIIGFLAGLLSGSNQGYSGFTRPPLTPPDNVFAVVWPILYFMMGNSLFFTLKKTVSANNVRVKNTAIILWGVQFALNIAWPFIFFALNMPTFAFIVITLLDFAVITLIVLDFTFDRLSAWLLVPYGAWILFATYLNVFIALYN